jgi:putative transposase
LPGPRPAPIELTEMQRAALERLIRRDTSPQRLVRRARLILAMAEGANNTEVARRLGHTGKVPPVWRRRWRAAAPALAHAEAEGAKAVEKAIAALLADRPRPGAPDTFSAEQVVQLLAIACEDPAASGRPIGPWSAREVAAEAIERGVVETISPRSVSRFLARRR